MDDERLCPSLPLPHLVLDPSHPDGAWGGCRFCGAGNPVGRAVAKCPHLPTGEGPQDCVCHIMGCLHVGAPAGASLGALPPSPCCSLAPGPCRDHSLFSPTGNWPLPAHWGCGGCDAAGLASGQLVLPHLPYRYDETKASRPLSPQKVVQGLLGCQNVPLGSFSLVRLSDSTSCCVPPSLVLSRWRCCLPASALKKWPLPWGLGYLKNRAELQDGSRQSYP